MLASFSVCWCSDAADVDGATHVPHLQASRLASFEMVKAIHLDSVEWTVENLLTPTFKLKRASTERVYRSQIDHLYAAVGDNVAGKAGLRQGHVVSEFNWH
jgi:hypothetical protein